MPVVVRAIVLVVVVSILPAVVAASPSKQDPCQKLRPDYTRPDVQLPGAVVYVMNDCLNSEPYSHIAAPHVISSKAEHVAVFLSLSPNRQFDIPYARRQLAESVQYPPISCQWIRTTHELLCIKSRMWLLDQNPAWAILVTWAVRDRSVRNYSNDLVTRVLLAALREIPGDIGKFESNELPDFERIDKHCSLDQFKQGRGRRLRFLQCGQWIYTSFLLLERAQVATQRLRAIALKRIADQYGQIPKTHQGDLGAGLQELAKQVGFQEDEYWRWDLITRGMQVFRMDVAKKHAIDHCESPTSHSTRASLSFPRRRAVTADLLACFAESGSPYNLDDAEDFVALNPTSKHDALLQICARTWHMMWDKDQNELLVTESRRNAVEDPERWFFHNALARRIALAASVIETKNGVAEARNSLHQLCKRSRRTWTDLITTNAVPNYSPTLVRSDPPCDHLYCLGSKPIAVTAVSDWEDMQERSTWAIRIGPESWMTQDVNDILTPPSYPIAAVIIDVWEKPRAPLPPELPNPGDPPPGAPPNQPTSNPPPTPNPSPPPPTPIPSPLPMPTPSPPTAQPRPSICRVRTSDGSRHCGLMSAPSLVDSLAVAVPVQGIVSLWTGRSFVPTLPRNLVRVPLERGEFTAVDAMMPPPLSPLERESATPIYRGPSEALTTPRVATEVVHDSVAALERGRSAVGLVATAVAEVYADGSTHQELPLALPRVPVYREQSVDSVARGNVSVSRVSDRAVEDLSLPLRQPTEVQVWQRRNDNLSCLTWNVVMRRAQDTVTLRFPISDDDEASIYETKHRTEVEISVKLATSAKNRELRITIRPLTSGRIGEIPITLCRLLT